MEKLKMKKLMFRVLFAFVALAAIPTATFAHDDWGYRAQAAAAAHEVDYAANDFANQVQWATGYSHLTGDAQHFSQDAAHFHDMIESNAPYEHLTYDYYDLERSYNHLGQAYYQAYNINRDPNIHEHWHQIEHAWQDLSWTFRGGHGPR